GEGPPFLMKCDRLAQILLNRPWSPSYFGLSLPTSVFLRFSATLGPGDWPTDVSRNRTLVIGMETVLKLATKFRVNPQTIQTATEAGFEFAEIWLGAKVLEDWREVARLANQSSLTYALHFPNRNNLTEAHLGQAIELYHALQCSAMVIHQPMLERYGTRLHELDPSVRLGVENHRLTPVEFLRWGSESDYLTLDVEHLWKLTLENCPLPKLLKEVRSFLERFHEKLIHVHLPGYVPGFDEHRPMYCSREMVFAVMSMLAEYRFGGLIVSEVELEFQNAGELQMDVLLFQRWKQLFQEQSDSAHVA
ncbi:MAG: hypothetical protein AAF497_29425, partial [Planctomycetota bacterium]